MLLKILSFPLLFSAVQAQFGYGCAPEGPKLPRPTNLAGSKFLAAATQNLTAQIEAALSGTLKAGWHVANTSFSIGIVASDSSKRVWEYHHRGTANVNGTTKVDGDSRYHIGSMSKLITDLVILKSGIDLSAPITKYIPELANGTSKIRWNDITIRQLADHLSGIPPNYGFSDYYYLAQKFESFGLPHIPTSDYNPCGVIGLNDACTKNDILRGMMTAMPVSVPNRRPVYSQLSFTLMAYALNTFSGGKTYGQLLSEILTGPLGMTSTSSDPGNPDIAVIPPVPSSYGSNSGESVPGGGLYSSLNDLTKLTYSFLTRTLMPEAQLLGWIKPTAFTASLSTVIGMPFEIFRSWNLTPDFPQIIDIYSKGGSSFAYSCKISFLDNYGVGIIVLTAGDALSRSILFDTIMSSITPAIEQEARDQAQKQYARTFSSISNATSGASNASTSWNVTANANSTSNIQATFSMDEGPGLILQKLTRGPYDMVAALPDIYQATFADFLNNPITFTAKPRMYPTEVVTPGTIRGRAILRESWRVKWNPVFDPKKWNGTDLAGRGSTSDECSTWLDADWIYYGGQPFERFVFVKDAANGEVLGVEVPWLRANLTVTR